MYKIGVVILNYKNYKMTEDCVEDLLRLQVPVQIVIVDNNSQNNSFAYLSSKFGNNMQIDVIANDRNCGYAAGNNFGISYLIRNHSNVLYVCIMNPDVRIGYKDVFQSLADQLNRDEKIAAITGLMIANSVLNLNSCYWDAPKGLDAAIGHFILAKMRHQKLVCNYDGVAYVDVIPGSFFMMKRSFFEKIGGLDEGTFLYNEENILALKVKELGMVNALSIGDYYYHNHIHGSRKSLKYKLLSRKNGNQSRRYLCKLYFGKKEQITLEVVIALNCVTIIIQHICGSIIRFFRRRDKHQ